MAYRTKESVSCQVRLECESLESSEGLPFQHLLNVERIMSALNRAGVSFRERIFPPTVAIWAWLSQIGTREHSSCRDAVGRVLADRLARGQRPCSTDTASYCAARGRLPEQVIADLARETGQGLHRAAPAPWLWKGRSVAIVDGSTATMIDTAENQAEYPQSRNQKPGLGFPILRFVLLLSLSVGTVLECAIGGCRGKKTGEQSLFRQMWDAFHPGDIVLGDRLYDAYRDIVLLKEQGIDVLFGKKSSRSFDFRRGRKLGPGDHVITWKKPRYDKSRYDSREQWESLSDEIEVREIRITVRRKGYRTRTVLVVTTLLDGEEYSAREVTDLFAERWHCELDLRSIKRSLGMHHLFCESPAMVRKELWMHLLAYNLIRVRMAQAAALHGATPRTLSFTAARDLLHSFAPYLGSSLGDEHRTIEAALLEAIAHDRVGMRPGRKEPRAIKKRAKSYSWLTKPRSEARKQLAA
jgi:hypothetical protein